MADQLRKHWTSHSIDNFVFSIAADFMLQIEKLISAKGTKQSEIAKVLGVSEGRVSQVLNTPGNLTFRNAVQYATAFGRKVAVVVYDDGDANNQHGPINGEIFVSCWQRQGHPTDFFELRESAVTTEYWFPLLPQNPQILRLPVKPSGRAANSASQSYGVNAAAATADNHNLYSPYQVSKQP
jgi:predicted XRE-type DNA-binding protein